MKKFLIVLFLILTLSVGITCIDRHVSPFYIETTVKFVDSGFDSDYDYDYDYGGSYSSSYDSDDYYSSSGSYSRSSGGSSSSSGSSGSLSKKESAILISIIFVIIPALIIGMYLAVRSYKKAEQRNASKARIINSLPPRVDADINFSRFAYNSYVEIQKAWTARDLSSVKHLLSDEMYNMYNMQLKTLIKNRQINVMKDFKYNFAYIYRISNVNGVETIKMILSVDCKDYIVSEDNMSVAIKGNKRDKLTYYYELTFVKNEVNTERHCPNCGALIENENATECQSCKASINAISGKYTLTNKVMLYQFKN